MEESNGELSLAKIKGGAGLGKNMMNDVWNNVDYDTRWRC